VVPLALFLFFPSTLPAADLRVGRRVTVLPSETISGNLYAAGAEIVISGNLTGDLVCAGGNVYVGGTVAEDAVVTGGDLNLTGRVRKDLRVAGGRVNLSGQVDGEFLVVGGQVHILPGASVGGDLVVAGGRVIVEGPVHGSLRAAGGEITINETVAGPVRVRASSVVIGSQARLGELTYLAPQEAQIAEGAQIRGPVTFHMTAGTDREWLGRALGRIGLAFLLLTFLMSLAAGLFAVLVFPKTSEELVRYTLHNFGKELLRGVVLFFVMPAAFFLATLTIVGLPLAVVAGLVHFTIGIVAVVFAGIAFGSLLWKTVAKKEEYEITWKIVLVGVPLLVLANLVPVIGLLCNAVFFLTVFGALYQRFWSAVRTAT